MEHLYRNYSSIWQAKNNSMDTLFNYIKEYQLIEMDDCHNITIRNTNQEKVPGFCCHLDTVHKASPSPVYANGVLFDGAGNGIGGDDKCGIVACLELLQQIPCKCVFFTEEEKGGVGAKGYDQEKLKDCKFLIEIDRRGNNDLIFQSGGVALCSKEFREAIGGHFDGYKEASGTFTDVNVLGEVGINMMNISSGYYLAHTTSEHVILNHLQRTISLLKSFAEKDLEFKPYKRRKKNNIIDGVGYGNGYLWDSYGKYN